MSTSQMPPWVEQFTGISVYATSTPKRTGTIKQIPEDFIVEEINNRNKEDIGTHLICTLTKKNWDTHHLVRDISRILRISQHRISWAGTKDKNAITTQNISIYDLDESALERIQLKDITINAIGHSNKKVSLGDHFGNKFNIIIRGINCSVNDTKCLIKQIASCINTQGGVPNFFGIQRFGVQRPITHIVGRRLVEGDIKGAALEYIARSCPGESEDARQARQYVFETCNYKRGLEMYPVRLRFERAMMNHLIERPGDNTGAFRALSLNLRRMFIHAYQSYLFNRILCRRIEKGIALNLALIGDIVCFNNAAGVPDTARLQKVTDDSLEGINNLLRKGRAFITAPLIGYDTPMCGGMPGEIEQTIITEEKINTNGFKIPVLPELASKGRRREIIIHVDPVYRVIRDILNPGCTAVEMEFSLTKGVYATTVLREFFYLL
jgi:tRNA pseudouridine13 synthase